MQTILNQLNIEADVVDVKNVGVLTRYFVRLRPGGTVKQIESRTNEIALGLKSHIIPLIKMIPKDGVISIDIITSAIDTVKFSEMLGLLHKNSSTLPVIIGKEYTGKPLIADITKMPHLLIAGTTGSGKSVMLHSIICSLIKQTSTPVKLILVDPKSIEFGRYKNIKQLLFPIINTPDGADLVLSYLIEEMDNRFARMSKFIYDVPSVGMEHIVLIIDEFSDLMQLSKKSFQLKLSRLAQKSRACGIHIVIATQRPSADVVTGAVKANCPAVVSFKVTSNMNSRVILDESGAEKLLGNGDGLIKSAEYDMIRFKGAYLEDTEIQQICKENQKSWWRRMINSVRNV